MNVTLIGTGNMARGIATRLAIGGHNLTIIGRDPEAAANLATQVRGSGHGTTVRTLPFGQQIQDEVVVLAVWYSAAAEILEQYGEHLAGKILIDITNPLNASYDGLVTAPTTSAAEEIASVAPQGARVVKAFNTVFAATLVNGTVAGQPLDVLIAGDDAEAKSLVAQLVESGSMRPIDAGPLSRARQLEALALLGITLQGTLGTSFQSAWKLLA